MKTRTCGVLLILWLVASAQPRATTCAAPNAIPAGAYVTPACTWIVEQWDPGVWRDNLGTLWAKIAGWSLPQIVYMTIGRP